MSHQLAGNHLAAGAHCGRRDGLLILLRRSQQPRLDLIDDGHCRCSDCVQRRSVVRGVLIPFV